MTAAARKSRRVLVVGATGRLGVAIGEALADRGDEVVLTARDPNKLELQAASLARPSTGNRRAPFVCADLTHRDAVERVVEGLRAAAPPTAERGSVDDIVLACGPFPRTPFDELRREDLVELGIVSDLEADADPLRQHRLATRSQLGRFGTPQEVVHVVTSLLDATWATGEIWGIGR